MVFSLVILVVLWALQFLLLDTFHERMKLEEVKKIGNQVSSKYDSDDFISTIGEASFHHNLRIVLLSSEGYPILSVDGFNQNANINQDQESNPNRFILPALLELQKSQGSRLTYLFENEFTDASHIVYIAKLFNQNQGLDGYLYMSSPLAPLDSTVMVLRTQFLIVSLVLMVLSLVMAQWISQRMSKPIIKLTNSATQIVKGNFDVEVYQSQYTEIQQLAQALDYAASELKSLENYRKEFLANISHDLKTPLTIIKFYTEMIQDISGDDPLKRNEHLDIILKETDWLSEMVGDVLELSKLDTGRMHYEMKTIHLSKILHSVMTSFHAFKDIHFKLEIEDDLNVLGDDGLLRRVFNNLIRNAINHTGEDNEILIRLYSHNHKVHFEVKDSGDAISPQQQRLIWERYTTLDKSHQRKVDGTGLGLPIVKGILELHHAHYGVISSENQGTTFYFELDQII